MMYLLIAMLTFNTALLYYLSWSVIDYLRWRRSWEKDWEKTDVKG